VETVYDIDMCTICGDPALWFSHRRDRGITGRQGGLVWLT
jgi:copper oxidase (laccase) domain-containing protein